MFSTENIPSTPTLLRLPRISDNRGNLTFCQFPENIPFEIKRIFYLYGMPEGATRGSHAHVVEHQILIPLTGAFDVRIFDGTDWTTYRLDSPEQALYIPPLYWRELHDFTPGAVCLTLSSSLFNPDDYLSPIEEFTDYLAAHPANHNNRRKSNPKQS